MQHAIDHKVPVFPLLVEDCDIPIEIYGKQHLDFRPAWPLEKGEAAYGSLLRRLVNDLGGNRSTVPTCQDKDGYPAENHSPFGACCRTTRVRQKDGMLMVYVPAGES